MLDDPELYPDNFMFAGHTGFWANSVFEVRVHTAVTY